MNFLTVLSAIAFCCGIANGAIRVKTADSNEVKRPGEAMELMCRFEFDSAEDFNLISYTPQWVKLQVMNTDEAGATEAVTVAVSAVVQTTFKTTGRYTAAAGPNNPETYFEIRLTINNIRGEDSGLYRCEILTSDGVIASGQHRLSVLTDVTSLDLVGATEYNEEDPNHNFTLLAKSENSAIIYYSTLNGYVDCRSVGGNPEPILRLYVGDRQLTGYMSHSETTEWRGEIEGLKTPYHEKRLYSYKLKLDSKDDDKDMRCVAEVHGQKSKEKKRKVEVHSEPAFDEEGCLITARAALGQDVLELNCKVYSKNTPLSIEWKAMSTQQTYNMKGSPYEGFEVSNQIESNYIISTLRVLEVDEVDFQSYTLTVQNDQGSNTKTISLSQGQVGKLTNGANRMTLNMLGLVLAFFVVYLTKRV